MEKWVKGKLSLFQIGVAMIILLIGIFLVEQTKSVQKTSYFAEQVEAAQLMKTCLEIIKEERLNRNIPIDKRLDPNQTGIIGEEFTKITTTLGNIDSKRTSSNPDFAALMLNCYWCQWFLPWINFSYSFCSQNNGFKSFDHLLCRCITIWSKYSRIYLHKHVRGFKYKKDFAL